MPRRTDISSVLVIGAGPIVIGQACEFDYSGTQACKVLKDEGYRVILVNSNPATIMTDPTVADSTYIEPLTTEILEKIIIKEKPDVILPTVGGQTALNLALSLSKKGILQKYNVSLIGANEKSIEKAENRELFKKAMDKIGLKCPKNIIAHSIEDALNGLDYIGLPAIIRPSFTLGGSGGGIANTKEEYVQIVKSGLEASPTNEVLIDSSIMGWKEYEMEVVRDKNDNCIIICSIENIDPMGVHTGDSITVAPALTLTDKEYQLMRNASIEVLREIGVDTGGSNVQFAINPDTGEMLVIEMNPRVSRSSALASKATGFPIAKVATKLAIGYSLDEILNDCTKNTPASFEPVIDYVVTKIPRFTFEKFSVTKPELTSAMKSVGEVMAIGRNFAESLQKALRSLEDGRVGFDELSIEDKSKENILKLLSERTPDRLLLVAEAFRVGLSVEEINKVTSYDKWFLRQIEDLVIQEENVKKNGLPEDYYGLFELKRNGFSDQRLAKLSGKTEHEIKNLRDKLGINPVFKRVDTCAAEFSSNTSYMYSTYEGNVDNFSKCESYVSDRKKVIILGSGPNRIGQGVEFDYTCVHAAYSLRDTGYETIMINCNPETVSTDYDTSDRLYFEPLTAENVIEIIRKESENGEVLGVNLQFGGQTPLKLAKALKQAGIKILGTTPEAIDLAEDRKLFQELIRNIGLKQPKNFICTSKQEAMDKVNEIGFPVVVRPSYVLGGRAMEIIEDISSLERYLNEYKEFFANGPILVDSFLSNATEVDVDAICDGNEVYIAGVMEHVEEAGIHSGDSACSIPPFSLDKDIVDRIIHHTKDLAKAIGVIGLMNVQYAIKDGEIYILEANPRASRTIPFVAKATSIQIAKIAARIMTGEKLSNFGISSDTRFDQNIKHFAVKEVVFPFARFPDVDVILGPEMKSTGEVMGIDKDFITAFTKAHMACNINIPSSGTVFISVKNEDKTETILNMTRELEKIGFDIIATKGTAEFLSQNNIKVKSVNKVIEGSPHIVDMIREGKVNLIINTTQGKQSILDSFSIRRTALMNKITCVTNLASAKVLIESIKLIKNKIALEVKSIQSYFN